MVITIQGEEINQSFKIRILKVFLTSMLLLSFNYVVVLLKQ